MVAFSPLLLDPDAIGGLLRDVDGNVRGALTCWAIALSTFVAFRIPRQVLLACLLAATVTVGFSALVADATSMQATVSPAKSPPSPAHLRALPSRPAAPVEDEGNRLP
jgi:hypothetical protein